MSHTVESSLDIAGREQAFPPPTNIEKCVLERHLDRQKELVTLNNIKDPFYEYTDKGEGALSYLDEQDGTRYVWGPIGGFSTNDVSLAINLQSNTYVAEGTMGSKFPLDKVDMLEAVFCGGFSRDTALILAYKKDDDGEWVPKAGITIFSNDSDRLLSATVNGSNIPSSISVTQSVRINSLTSRQREILGDTLECEVATPSRFWKDKTTNIGPKTTLNIIHLVPHAAVSVSLFAGRELPKMLIYDTHMPSLVRLTTDRFGAQLLASGSEISPTESVLNGVLGYHYGPEEIGGYQGKVSVVTFDTKVFLERSRKGLDEMGMDRVGFSNEEIEILFDTVESQSIIPSPEEFAERTRPEIIDANTAIGALRLEKLKKVSIVQDIALLQLPNLNVEEMIDLYNNPEKSREIPFLIGKESIIKLSEGLKRLPETESELIELVKNRLDKTGVSIDSDNFEAIFGWVLKDIIHLKIESHRLSKTVDQDSRWIHMPSQNRLTRYIGRDAHNLLSQSRLLGLVPFERINSLRSKKIRCIGASVANMTLHALVAAGVSDICFVDGDEVSPESAQRQAAISYSDMGRSKVSVLQDALYERNPYGRYVGLSAKAVPENEVVGQNQVGLESFLEDADIVLEAIDQGRIKWQVRSVMSTHAPGKVIVMPTDASVPFVAFEGSGYGVTYFNSNHSPSEVVVYSKPPETPFQGLKSVIKTVEADVPTDHAVPIILLGLGIIPFISQHPASAMMSASIAVQGLTDPNSYLGRNLKASDLPDDGFAVVYTPEQKKLIKDIFGNLFY